MKTSSIMSEMPKISYLHRAFDYYLKKGSYQRYSRGRPWNAFIYVEDGSMLYDFGDSTLSLKKGDMIFVARGTAYMIHISTHASIYQIDFGFDLPGDTVLQSEVVTPSGSKQLEYTFRSCITSWQMLHFTRHIDCMYALYAVYSSFLHAKKDAYLSPQKRQRMEQAAEYIDAHIGDSSLDLEKIASAMSMSKSHLRHCFKEVHGMTLSEYIQRRRIRLSKNLLEFSSESLTSIAQKVGYSGIYYFSHTFKKEVGYSPNEYRKRKQAEM